MGMCIIKWGENFYKSPHSLQSRLAYGLDYSFCLTFYEYESHRIRL